MAISNAKFEEEFDTTNGMDATSPLATLKPGFVRAAYNSRYGLISGYKKRGGILQVDDLDSGFSTRTISAGLEYKTSTGIIKLVVFGANSANGLLGINDGTAPITSVDANSVVLAKTRPSLIQFKDLLFFFNGGDNEPFIYDGTSIRQMGIDAPNTSPVENSQSATGNLTLLGTYQYTYTYYNSLTGAESSPVLQTQVTLTGANNEVTLGLVAADPTTADIIRIYRSFANQRQLFLESEIAGASVSHSSTLADNQLETTELELDNSRITQIAPKAKFALEVANRIFLVTADNEIRWSKIGQNGAMPESYEVKSIAKTEGRFGANDKIVGLGRAGNRVIILKERSIGTLDAIGIPDTRLSSDNVIFIYREISTDAGAISHWSATEVNGECVFLGRNNIYGTHGEIGDLRQLADGISGLFPEFGLQGSKAELLASINDPENRVVMFSVYRFTNSPLPDWILIGDYQRNLDFRWSIDRPGTNLAANPGYCPASMFTRVNSNGKIEILFGKLEPSGEIHQLNVSTNDNGNGIYWRIESRPYIFGLRAALKDHKGVRATVKGNGNNYPISIFSRFALDELDEFQQVFSLASGDDFWDLGLWDIAKWASGASVAVRYDIHCKSEYVQYVFQNTEPDQPILLHGWTAVAIPFRV